ncbi:Cytochrome P450 1A1 [Labeo rohita]|uniref:Cytochrome P450 1A1 n=1 Tax=Labeo rohita TaxID=84645 RepID=A0ABQ8MLY5_LABRO|nr:Cytochrome P450 1A1 [Labeo rohita]
MPTERAEQKDIKADTDNNIYIFLSMHISVSMHMKFCFLEQMQRLSEKQHFIHFSCSLLVDLSEMNKGFYSHYFIVHKKGRGLRLILDIRAQAVSLAAIWSPCIFTKVTEAAFVLLNEVGIPNLTYSTSTTANSSSLLRVCVRTQGPCAQASGQAGTLGQMGKEQALPCAEHLFSWCRTGISRQQRSCLLEDHAHSVLNCLPQASCPKWVWHHGMHRVSITSEFHHAYRPWKNLVLLWAGVPLEQVSRHIDVTMGASKPGCGGVCNRNAVLRTWTGSCLDWHIKYLEFLAVFLALRREDMEQVLMVAPYRPYKTWFSELVLMASSLVDFPDDGRSFSEARHNLAPAPRPLELSCLVPGEDGKDPRRCGIGSVLFFLQRGLDSHLFASTLKVYVATIAVNHDIVGGRSVKKDNLIIRFLRGVERLNPPGPLFEPLKSVELSASDSASSIRRMGVLKALSVNETDKVVTLQAIPPDEGDPDLSLLCPRTAVQQGCLQTENLLQGLTIPLLSESTLDQGCCCFVILPGHWKVTRRRDLWGRESNNPTKFHSDLPSSTLSNRCSNSSASSGHVLKSISEAPSGRKSAVAILESRHCTSLHVTARHCTSLPDNRKWAKRRNVGGAGCRNHAHLT